jgi:hypothetical protein
VRRIIFVAAFAVCLCSLAVAQDAKVMPPVTAIQIVHDAVHANPSVAPSWPKFCKKTNCLYYAGDFDSTSSNANGLFNANDTGGGLEGQVWVGVKPTEKAVVTGSTFNQFFMEEGVGTNPTPFAVQVGITEGNAGKTVCNTSGNATETVYGESDFGLTQYSYTVKKFRKSCQFKKGTVYFVNLLPTFSDNYGYLVNVGGKAKNHKGWPNQHDNCFFNGAAFGADYVTCDSQGSGTDGFAVLSIALTGTE